MTESRGISYPLFIFSFFLLEIFLVFLFLLKGPLVLVVLVAALFLPFLMSLERFIMAISVALIVISFSPEVFPLLNFGWMMLPSQVLVWIALGLAIVRYVLKGRATFQNSDLDIWFVLLFMAIIISLGRGILAGHRLPSAVIEFLALSGYLGYFLPRMVEHPESFGKTYLLVILFSGAFVGFLYLFFLFKEPIFRIVTRQGNMALFAFILALNRLALKRDSPLMRILLTISIVLSLAAVGATLQRALWISALFGVFVSLIVWAYLRVLSVKTFAFLLGGLVFIIFSLLFLLGKSSIFWYGFMIAGRLSSLSHPLGSVTAIQERIIQHQLVFERIRDSFFFGAGLGDFLWLPTSRFTVLFIDSSLGCFLWKTGILGTLFFVLFMGRALWITFKVMASSEEPDLRWFSASILIGVLSLIVVSLTTAFFFNYRFIFIIAVLFGLLSYEYDKLKLKKGRAHPES